MKKMHHEYSARVGGVHRKKFVRTTDFMNATWDKFNRYAKSRGYTTPVQGGQYLGALAWQNDAGDIMELVHVDLTK